MNVNSLVSDPSELMNVIQDLSEIISTYLQHVYNAEKDIADKTFKMDLTQYMMYLAAADGPVQWDEASIISKYLGSIMSPHSMDNIVKDMSQEAFEKRIPLSLEVLVQCDMDRWDNSESSGCLAQVFLRVYNCASEELLDDNARTNDLKKTFMTRYMSNMWQFISAQEGISCENDDLREDQTYTSVPVKIGVSAPKKH